MMAWTHRIRAELADRLRRLDDDEDGAILLACLAGSLIIFMVALTMYDAGNVTREKIKLQTATDTAAYSQASIKARTMNANAYVNVTKRSIMGINLTYFTALNYFNTDMFHASIACQNASATRNCTVWNKPTTCNSSAANTTSTICASGTRCCNIFVASHERSFDFFHNNPSSNTYAQNYGGSASVKLEYCKYEHDPSDPTGSPACVPVPITERPASLMVVAQINMTETGLEDAKLYGAVDKYAKELRQLTRYQEYMQVITPWWALSEAMARATHNGATLATSYPAPANLKTSNISNYPVTPSAAVNMEDDWSWSASNTVSGLTHVGLAGQFKSHQNHICSQFTGGTSADNPFADELFNEEMKLNVEMLSQSSDGSVGSDGYAALVLREDADSPDMLQPIIGGYSSCYLMHDGIMSMPHIPNGSHAKVSTVDVNTLNAAQGGYATSPIMDPAYSFPYMVTVNPKTSDLAQMRMSNIVFGFYEGSDFKRKTSPSGEGMTRFEYMTQNYVTSLPESAQGTGIWTTARGEIVSLGDQDGNWHTSWTARIRPVSRPDELNNVSNEMNPSPGGDFMADAFQVALPYLEISHSIAPNPAVSGGADTETMERAMGVMDSNSAEGFFK